MLEILQFIFQDFIHFAGTCFLLMMVHDICVNTANAFRGIRSK